MTTSIIRFSSMLVRVSGAIVMVLGLVACSSKKIDAIKTSASSLQGQVVEVGSKRPLAGAIIVALWKETLSAAPIPADSRTVCGHLESTITDSQGDFQLPTWQGYAPSMYISYKAGYIRSDDFYQPQYLATSRYIDLLQPFKGTKSERLKYLSMLFDWTQCIEVKDSTVKRLPLVKAIVEEAESVGGDTPEERKNVESLVFGMESMEYGAEEALERMRERREKGK